MVMDMEVDKSGAWRFAWWLTWMAIDKVADEMADMAMDMEVDKAVQPFYLGSHHQGERCRRNQLFGGVRPTRSLTTVILASTFNSIINCFQHISLQAIKKENSFTLCFIVRRTILYLVGLRALSAWLRVKFS